MATALLAMGTDAEAQVIYTDVDPDYTFTNEEYEIDFDGDGISDVTLTQSQYTTAYQGFNLNVGGGGVMPAPGNAVMGAPNEDDIIYPSLLQVGAPIGAGAEFASSTGTLGVAITGDLVIEAGPWLGQTGYIGVRFQANGGTTHYGWVQLALAADAGSMTVMGYGYESTPLTTILAGDIGGATGVQNVQAGLDFSVAPNPAADLAQVNLAGIQGDDLKLTVLDASGKAWVTETIGMRSNTYSLDVSSLAPGIYFVRLESGEKVGYQKIIKI